MAAFYNQGDQEIYKNFQYVPQEKYRLGFTAPTVNEQKIAQTFGIPNTNAFTNSGGNGFNQSGNAFGYGSPVSEVNVRTFNPQSNDPTGKIANAQTMYNKASNAGPMVETFTGMRPSESVMDYYGGQIMDNREQYGAQGQYNSPYDDTVDLGYMGRDTSTSLDGTVNKDAQGNYIGRRKSGIGKAIDFVTDFIPGVGAVKRGAKFIGGLLPDNPNGPGGGSYSVAGLSDEQKGVYNSLAKDGMLFDGPGGLKSITGKNFTGSGYIEGQIENAYGFGFDTMTEEEIEEDLAAAKANKNKQFEYRQKIEALNVLRNRQKEFEKPGGTKDQVAAIQGRIDKEYANQLEKDGRDFSVSGPDTSSNPTGKSNQASSQHGYNMHQSPAFDGNKGGNKGGFDTGGGKEMMARGGRAGYFFGGRVNFKDGGLASIL